MGSSLTLLVSESAMTAEEAVLNVCTEKRDEEAAELPWPVGVAETLLVDTLKRDTPTHDKPVTVALSVPQVEVGVEVVVVEAVVAVVFETDISGEGNMSLSSSALLALAHSVLEEEMANTLLESELLAAYSDVSKDCAIMSEVYVTVNREEDGGECGAKSTAVARRGEGEVRASAKGSGASPLLPTR